MNLPEGKMPLSGVRVLDLSRILAGPWATQNLADLGAAVVKVELPGKGDDTRSWGPPFAPQRDGANGDATYFFCCNRGKQSVTIDFTYPEGRDLLLKMAAEADVLVENFKVGGLAKYGLDYASLSAVNPRLVYCSITGFGQTGPYAARPGYDALIQGMGGLMSVTGEPDDRPGGAPQKVGVAVVDIMTGLYATSAILAALYESRASGRGQAIDIALLDVQVATLANQASGYLLAGHVPERIGSAHPSIVPYQPFACADGHVILAIGNDSQFAAFCASANCEMLASDARFSTNTARVANRIELLGLLSTRLLEKTIDEWLDLGQRYNFPCGPINTIDRVFEDAQVRARHMVVQQSSGDKPPRRMIANPMKFSRSRITYDTAPPALGEHTDAVLSDMGVSPEERDILRSKKII